MGSLRLVDSLITHRWLRISRGKGRQTSLLSNRKCTCVTLPLPLLCRSHNCPYIRIPSISSIRITRRYRVAKEAQDA